MRTRIAVVAVLVLAFTALALAADDPFAGTWTLNLGQIQPAQTPASTTPDSVLLLREGTFQCLSCDPKIKIEADGTDQAVPLQKPYDYDVMAMKIVDDKTTESIAKKDGKVLYTTRNTISPDGKTSLVEIVYPEGSNQGSLKLTYKRVAEGPPGSHAVSGTWRRQNVDLSGNGRQPANAPTITFKSTPDGLISSGSLVGRSDVRVDGKDYPGPAAISGATVSLNRVNERLIDQISKRDGKILSVAHLTVSEDGQTMTIRLETQVQGGTGLTLTATKQ
jgi:hypothetical protein